MHNLTNLIDPAIFSDGTGTFYCTLASVSVVFVIVACTFSIYVGTVYNKIIHTKKEEINKYNFKIVKYKIENERIEKIIERLRSDDMTKDEEKERRYIELVTDNNFLKLLIENKIKENKELINHTEKRKTEFSKLIKWVYLFLFMFMIIPLFFLSSTSNETISALSIMLKTYLLVIFSLFAIIVVLKCETILQDDIYDIYTPKPDTNELNPHSPEIDYQP